MSRPVHPEHEPARPHHGGRPERRGGSSRDHGRNTGELIAHVEPWLSHAPLEEVAVDFEVHDTDADEGWRVAHATLTEVVSDLSTATLLLSHRDLGADPHALLGRTCTVTLRRGEQRLHAMSGLLGSVVNGGPSPRRRLARVIVTSSLGALSLRRDYRCFQDLDAVAVIKEVLREANVYQRKGALEVHVDRRHLPRREYCVQYGETDLEFVRRLLEEEGLFFYFKALDGDGDGEAREVLVIDDPQRRRRRSDHVPSPAGAVSARAKPHVRGGAASRARARAGPDVCRGRRLQLHAPGGRHGGRRARRPPRGARGSAPRTHRRDHLQRLVGRRRRIADAPRP